MSDKLGLGIRTGLPGHLRILTDKYPRGDWSGHHNFDELTRFWLDRHLMFREILARLTSETEGFLDRRSDPRSYGSNLPRLAGFFINQLHGHHQIEDGHYFPLLLAREARLSQAFDLLETDHQVLDSSLDGLTKDVEEALIALQNPVESAMAAGKLLTTLVGFDNFLNRHLTDEEEIVVPVILEHGGPDMG